MIKQLLNIFKQIAPQPVKNLLRKIGLDRLWLMFYDKYDVELNFQQKWVKDFVGNESKVLEYWKSYRYLDEIERICEINGSKKILDVGCGISTVLHFLKGQKVGIDPLAYDYSKLYNYPREVSIIRALGEEIPFKEQYFDIVFCSNVLDHTTNPQKSLAEIFRVLKNDGYFVLTVEVFENKENRDLSHPHCFTKENVYSLIENKFTPVFENKSPWIQLRFFVLGHRESVNDELVMICQKRLSN